MLFNPNRTCTGSRSLFKAGSNGPRSHGFLAAGGCSLGFASCSRIPVLGSGGVYSGESFATGDAFPTKLRCPTCLTQTDTCAFCSSPLSLYPYNLKLVYRSGSHPRPGKRSCAIAGRRLASELGINARLDRAYLDVSEPEPRVIATTGRLSYFALKRPSPSGFTPNIL